MTPAGITKALKKYSSACEYLRKNLTPYAISSMCWQRLDSTLQQMAQTLGGVQWDGYVSVHLLKLMQEMSDGTRKSGYKLGSSVNTALCSRLASCSKSYNAIGITVVGCEHDIQHVGPAKRLLFAAHGSLAQAGPDNVGTSRFL